MFIATLFPIAKTRKQPKHPWSDDWIQRIWYIHTVEYYSAVKNKVIPFTTTWMQLEIIIPSEVNQKEKDKYYMMSVLCRI